MKANELMIGDWVHIDSMSKVPPHNDQVIKIFEKYCDTDNSFIGWEYVEPIPLTEEILKANGFENIIGYEYYYSTPLLRQSGIVLTINSEMVVTNWTDHNENVFVEFSCAFVHELQHALRLCGLNDLADNFKIE